MRRVEVARANSEKIHVHRPQVQALRRHVRQHWRPQLVAPAPRALEQSWPLPHTSEQSREEPPSSSLCLRPAACEEREIGPSPCRQTLLLPRTRPLRTDRRRINHAAGAAGVRKDEVDNEESARFVVERARHSNRRNQHINDCIGDQHRSKRLCQGVWREQCCGSPRRTDRTLNTDCDNVGLWTLRV